MNTPDLGGMMSKAQQSKRKFAPCCGICENEFDEADFTPLLLTACGHSLCKECADALLQAKKIKCPTCSAVTPAASVASLPKNFALIDGIRELATTTAALMAAPQPVVDVGKVSARELDDFQEKIVAEKFKRGAVRKLEILAAVKNAFDATVTAWTSNNEKIKTHELQLAQCKRDKSAHESRLRSAKTAIDIDRSSFIASHAEENKRLLARVGVSSYGRDSVFGPRIYSCPALVTTPDTSAFVRTLPPGFGHQ
mmetsp:Transcript_28456/g.63047  ORF Transcript_28456/g.63047 Transcript_28456/m.63047 type:complete len:253 (+) Transcript_28456:41-799(+)